MFFKLKSNSINRMKLVRLNQVSKKTMKIPQRKKSRILALATINALISSQLALADQMTFSVMINDAGALPRTTAAQEAKPAAFVSSNTFNIGYSLLQGDYDVVHFRSNHPSFYFADGPDVKLVLGYWVHPTAEGYDLPPTKSNWVPLGYASAPNPSNGQVTSKFIEINKTDLGSNSNPDGFLLIRNTMEGLKSLAGGAFVLPTQTKAPYQVHFAVMAAHDYANTGGMNMNSAYANPAEVAISFSQFADSIISSSKILSGKNLLDLGTTPAEIDKVKKGYLSHGSRSISLSFDSKGTYSFDLESDAQSKKLFDLAKDVLTKSSFMSLSDTTRSDLKSIRDKLAGAGSDCNSIIPGGGVQKWWEPFPLNLACKALNGGGSGLTSNFVINYDLFYRESTPAISDSAAGSSSPPASSGSATPTTSASSSPSAGSASTGSASASLSPEGVRAQKILGALLVGAAIMNTTQKRLPADHQPTARIFDESPYINRILSSSTIPIRISGNEIMSYQPANSVHPEQYFAIQDYPPYFVSGSGDALAVWMNRADKNTSDIILNVGDSRTSSYSTNRIGESGFTIQMILRSLSPEKGGGWFCEINRPEQHS